MFIFTIYSSNISNMGAAEVIYTYIYVYIFIPWSFRTFMIWKHGILSNNINVHPSLIIFYVQRIIFLKISWHFLLLLKFCTVFMWLSVKIFSNQCRWHWYLKNLYLIYACLLVLYIPTRSSSPAFGTPCCHWLYLEITSWQSITLESAKEQPANNSIANPWQESRRP